MGVVYKFGVQHEKYAGGTPGAQIRVLEKTFGSCAETRADVEIDKMLMLEDTC